MVELNFDDGDQLLAAADAEMERREAAKPPRLHLGMSGGGYCPRRQWYGWLWAGPRRIPARGLRAIDDGVRGEDVIAARIQASPVGSLLTRGSSRVAMRAGRGRATWTAWGMATRLHRRRRTSGSARSSTKQNSRNLKRSKPTKAKSKRCELGTSSTGCKRNFTCCTAGLNAIGQPWAAQVVEIGTHAAPSLCAMKRSISQSGCATWLRTSAKCLSAWRKARKRRRACGVTLKTFVTLAPK